LEICGGTLEKSHGAGQKSHGAAEKLYGAAEKLYGAPDFQSAVEILQSFNSSILQFFNSSKCDSGAGVSATTAPKIGTDYQQVKCQV